MSKILVISTGNWADEIDVEGFMIVSKECWEWKKLEWNHTEFPQEISIGTNEYAEFENVEEYLNSFKIKEISDEEAELLRKLFDISSRFGDFGHVLWIEGDASESFYDKHGHCPE